MPIEQNSQRAEFSKWRMALWPIHNFEMKKFLPLSLIIFLVLFNYTILYDIKDVLIVTSPNGGAPVLSFLKGWGVMPAAIFFVVIYTKLSNVMSQAKIFYGAISFFLIFFGVFVFILYPYQEILHPNIENIKNLQETYPHFRFLFPVWGVWTYSLFYIFSELWGTAMISLFFWQFANQIVRTDEAKRYYALFGLIGNFALVAAGQIVKHFSKLAQWDLSMRFMIFGVIISGLIAMYSYYWIHVNVLTDKRFYDPEKTIASKKKKVKLSVIESFKYIFSNPYLGYIAILVIGYNVSMNLIEVVWKDQIHQAFPNPQNYAHFMGQFSQNTGIATIFLILFTKGVVRRFGWFVGAIITPLTIIITGGLFFSVVLYQDMAKPVAAILGFSSVMSAAWIGSVQNILTRGTKYSQFDPTKEMAYIPLDQESQTKGKATVDVIGSRFGKAAGGYMQQIIFIASGTKDVVTVAPYFAGIVTVVIAGWIWAVGRLSKSYTALINEQESSTELSLKKTLC